MKIDFHVHSKRSTRPSQWFLKKIGCPESFTEPLQIYRIAKQKGMSWVTITDHNAIDGALEIAHFPDAFVSEEITTYFPEDRCKLHVLALDITEAQHKEIQKCRENVFDLTACLHGEGIFHILAHPLYAVNDRLTRAHFEQLLLLFKNFELNGARNPRENLCLRSILSVLTAADIDRLADRHQIRPLFDRPWEKRLFGGSDDHSALNVACAYTVIEGADHPAAFFRNPDACRIDVSASHASPLTLARNLYSIAYQYYRNKFGLDRYADKDVLLRFLDHALLTDLPEEKSGLLSKLHFFWRCRKAKNARKPASDSLNDLLRHEIHRLIRGNPDLLSQAPAADASPEDRDRQWFEFVDQVSNRVLAQFADHLLDHLSGANVFNIFHTIGSAGGCYTLLAPYFVGFSQFMKDRSFSAALVREFDGDAGRPNAPDPASEINIAHFTDTFYEDNDVAHALQQYIRTALKNRKQLTMITCGPDAHPGQTGMAVFKPIGVYQFAEYPDQKLFYPPLLEMLNYCYSRGFTHIHAATPGPIGLAALAIARILKLPLSGACHAAIPQYAQMLTEDEAVADLAWKYIVWFYNQLDMVYAPSRSARDDLIRKGIAPEKIKVMPQGTDLKTFHPRHGNGFYRRRFNLTLQVKLLYVGRASREKNLHILAGAFRRLVRAAENVSLIIVGDGPYLEEMKREVADLPCYFTGHIEGSALSEAYASADIFVYPSAADTFGHAVLEAQASGLPAIVTDQGGPRENILLGKTGLVAVAGDEASLFDAMLRLTKDGDMRRRMGLAARRRMESRSFETAFIRTWQMYQDPIISQRAELAEAG